MPKDREPRFLVQIWTKHIEVEDKLREIHDMLQKQNPEKKIFRSDVLDWIIAAADSQLLAQQALQAITEENVLTGNASAEEADY